jgi:hypothetical protein
MSVSRVKLAAAALAAAATIATIAFASLAQAPSAPTTAPSAPAPIAQTANDPKQDPLIPRRQFLAIDWAGARAAAAYLPRERRLSLLRSATDRAGMAARLTLPLVLPGEEALFEKLRLYTTHDHQYAATAAEDGALIELMGSRISAVAPAEAAEALAPLRLSADRARGYRIERTDYGVDITFNRFGAVYNISILCDNPYKDDRCTKDDYAVQLMESTIVLVGEEEAPQQ